MAPVPDSRHGGDRETRRSLAFVGTLALALGAVSLSSSPKVQEGVTDVRGRIHDGLRLWDDLQQTEALRNRMELERPIVPVEELSRQLAALHARADAAAERQDTLPETLVALEAFIRETEQRYGREPEELLADAHALASVLCEKTGDPGRAAVHTASAFSIAEGADPRSALHASAAAHGARAAMLTAEYRKSTGEREAGPAPMQLGADTEAIRRMLRERANK